jgi:2-oxoglutarate ferredoxin oxidoreductase subunit beta
MRTDGRLEIVDVATVGADALLVHDPGRVDPGLAFSLANLSSDPTGPTPIGVFRDIQRPVFGQKAQSDRAATDDELADMLVSGDTWTIA